MFYLRLSRLNDYDRVKNIPVSFLNKGDVNIELLLFGTDHNYTCALEFIVPILLGLLFSFMFTLIPIILLTKKRPIDIIKFNQ